MDGNRSKGLFLAALAVLGACRSAEPDVVAAAPVPAEASTPSTQLATPEVSNRTFAYLLERYDVDGDVVITADEYTRHDGQFARWDADGDGRLTEADWSEEDPTVMPQILVMQRLDVLGRYFQTDENENDVLTIDELANAFLEYDGAGDGNEELTEAEFHALAEERAVVMPGDGSMMKQSYVGNDSDWGQLVGFYDLDGNRSLDLMELTVVFEEADVYELRFDRIRFDDGTAGSYFEELAYEAGLVVGSDVPAVTLTSLHDDETVELAGIAGQKPIALIFGSYT